jgi:hypothetical protein
MGPVRESLYLLLRVTDSCPEAPISTRLSLGKLQSDPEMHDRSSLSWEKRGQGLGLSNDILESE